MINVKYSKNYDYIEVSGHANSAPYGQDLVCASVSTIMTGLCNHLLKVGIDKKRIEIDSGFVKIDTRGKLHVNKFLEMAITQLETLEEAQPEYIRLELKKNV